MFVACPRVITQLTTNNT